MESLSQMTCHSFDLWYWMSRRPCKWQTIRNERPLGVLIESQAEMAANLRGLSPYNYISIITHPLYMLWKTVLSFLNEQSKIQFRWHYLWKSSFKNLTLSLKKFLEFKGVWCDLVFRFLSIFSSSCFHFIYQRVFVYCIWTVL